ncbi:MAG: peptide deformylase [Phycisphaeraceae bacterium]|nr:peptide deformylase [Phycisphaeraceae bacterium]
MPVDPSALSIIRYPDPRLRARCRAIERVDETVVAVARRMLELMHQAPGVGLAAPQVGLNWRLFVACPSTNPEDDAVFINPSISPVGRQLAEYEEGCLSLPEIEVSVMRPAEVTIEATGLDGRTFQMSGDGLAARVWQHELDHLDGVLIIDRATPTDRLASQRKLRELEEEFKPVGR